MAAWTIRLVVLVAFLDLFMQLPVISTYAGSVGAAAAMVGAIVGMYSAANLVGNIGAGILLDRVSRRRLMIAGMLLTSASLYAYGFVTSPIQLLLLRTVHGLSASVLAPGAFAMLGDRTRSRHTHSMGLSGSLIAVSAVVGPPLAGGIGDTWGFGAVFATSGTLTLLAAIVFWLRVPDPPRPSPNPQRADRPTWAVPLNRTLASTFIAVLAMTFSIGVLISHLPIIIELSGGSSRIAGISFATFSLVATAVMVSPIQRALDGRSHAPAVGIGLGLLGVSGVVLAIFRGSVAGALPSMVVFGLGFGLLFPSLAAAVSQHSNDSQRGTAFGIFYAMYSLGVFLGAVVSGSVYEISGGASTPFLAGAAVALLGMPMAAGIRTPRTEERGPA